MERPFLQVKFLSAPVIAKRCAELHIERAQAHKDGPVQADRGRVAGEGNVYTQAQPLTVKEYQGERIITFKDVDTLHQHPEGTARKRFNDNRSRFIEGEDFYKITPSEFRTAFGGMDACQQMDVTLLTQMGYLMLVRYS